MLVQVRYPVHTHLILLCELLMLKDCFSSVACSLSLINSLLRNVSDNLFDVFTAELEHLGVSKAVAVSSLPVFCISRWCICGF